ncbi:MAG TPA: biotin/lipoyl-containing protein [Elusimicrobiota bacterium]|nr:biotin/lipoyl-containing protein [Elusimicrobiota bacterium]
MPKKNAAAGGTGKSTGNGGAPFPKKGESLLGELKSIYDFMLQNNLESLELSETGRHVRLARRKAPAPMPVPVPVAAAGAYAAPAAAGSAATAPAGPSAPAALPPGGVTVKSGMMGIFYRAPSPSSPPYIKEGDHVSAGQIIGMIEAMKVFNEIKAEFDCTVVKALLENGKPVKLGQDIFLVRRD